MVALSTGQSTITSRLSDAANCLVPYDQGLTRTFFSCSVAPTLPEEEDPSFMEDTLSYDQEYVDSFFPFSLAWLCCRLHHPFAIPIVALASV